MFAFSVCCHYGPNLAEKFSIVGYNGDLSKDFGGPEPGMCPFAETGKPEQPISPSR